MEDRKTGELTLNGGNGRFRFTFSYRLVMTTADRCPVCSSQAGKVEGGVAKAWADGDESQASIPLSDPRVNELAKTVNSIHWKDSLVCTQQACQQSWNNLMAMH